MNRLLRGLVLIAALGGLAVLAASAALQWWEPPEMQPTTAEMVANPGERVTVQVLNAGGVAGMAQAATGILRDAGFDVVEFGNADSFDRDSSVVLARMGRVDLASMVAEALAIPTYQDEADSTAFVDITVLIGSSWEPALIRPEPEPAPDTLAAPESEPGWRGVLIRLRDWADGLSQADNQS